MRIRTKLIAAAGAIAVSLLALPATGSAKTVTTKTTLTFVGQGVNPIPAMGSAGLYPWSVYSFGLAGKTTSVEITLNGLVHERVSDLDALLVAPDGVRNTMFMSDVGDDTDIPPPGVNVTFRDGDRSHAPIGSPLKSGTYRPTNGIDTNPDAFASPAPPPPYGTTLSRLKGQTANGLWSLYLTDDDGNPVAPATGSVQSFALKISSQLKTKVKTKRRKRGCKRFRGMKRANCKCKKIKNKKKRKKCKRRAKRARGR